MYTVYEIVFYLSLAARFVPLVMIVWYYKHQPVTYRWLAALLFLSFGCDTAAQFLYWLRLPVNIASSFYSIVDPIVISVFFYFVLGWKSLLKPLILFNGLFLLFSVGNLVLVQQLNMNSYTSIGHHLLILALCILYFYKQITELTMEKIQGSGMFWIVTAMLITFSAQLVLFTFVEYLIHVMKDNLIIPWILHNSLMLIRSLVIIYGVHIHNQKLRLFGIKNMASN